jgi:hypothetical protein
MCQSMEGELRDWAKLYRLEKGVPASEATHYSYKGAKYRIPKHLTIEWLKAYAVEMETNPRSLFIIEKRTPVFRMHYDLDFIQQAEVTVEEVQGFARLFTGVLRSFYPALPAESRTFVSIIMSAPSKPKRGWIREGELEADMVVKSGFHILWPWMYVDQEQALRLRESCVLAANQHHGHRQPPDNPFADVIDESVLLTNGLRMVGSDKCSACTRCKGKGKDPTYVGTCVSCEGNSTIAENRVYMPVTVLGADGLPNDAHLATVTQSTDLFECVRLCSIRSSRDNPTAGYTPPPLAPPSTAVAKLRRTQKRKVVRLQTTSDDREFRDDKASNSALVDAEEIEANTTLFQLVEDFLTTRMGPQWSGLELKKFFLQAKSNRYLAKVRGAGASFCTNVNRSHASSTVYFVFEPDGVSQRCFSKKEGQTDAPCRKFKGAMAQLPVALQQALFTPEEHQVIDDIPSMPNISGHVFEHQLASLEASRKLAAASRVRRKREMEEAAELEASLAAQKQADECVTSSVGGKKTPAKKKKKSKGDEPHPILTDLTCRKVDKLSYMDLCQRDRQHAEEARALTQLIRDECFEGKPAPTVAHVKKKRKVAKTK